MKEAMLWKPFKGKAVKCGLCRHGCVISDGKRGLCRVRENRGGKLYALTYGKPCSANPDAIEKKPLYHFLPGTDSFSIATVGCNFRCLMCQNYSISQVGPEEVPSFDLPPEKVVEQAIWNQCPSISYTYTEPTVFFEYAFDTSQLAHKQGLKNVFVTNGYMSPETIKKYESLDAANVDVKGDEEFYRKVCGAQMEGVLDSIKLLHKRGVHVEVTNLIIPGYNDDDDSIRSIAGFVKGITPEMPLHFSAFYPCHKLKDAPPTPRDTLVKAREISLEVGVKYVYCGNTFPGDPFDNTYCPNCGEKVIERYGFSVASMALENGKCTKCEEKISLVLE